MAHFFDRGPSMIDEVDVPPLALPPPPMRLADLLQPEPPNSPVLQLMAAPDLCSPQVRSN